MVTMAYDGESSPVTITVSSSGGFRHVGLTSPVSRHSISNNSNSPLSGREFRRSSGGNRRLSLSKESTEEFVAYTVHIPPTPDHQTISNSQSSPPEYSKIHGNPNENHIKDTLYTGGFKSATRAHARLKKSVEERGASKSKTLCAIDGCDEKLIDRASKAQCECGFKICRECYLDCCGNGGFCPGCKEPFREANDDDDDEPESELNDQANPLPKTGGGGGIRLDKKFSLVQSFKAPNQDFDHTRWLFETHGTYGFGNALWPRDGYDYHGTDGHENPPLFNDRRNRPMTRKLGISAAIISPYR